MLSAGTRAKRYSMRDYCAVLFLAILSVKSYHTREDLATVEAARIRCLSGCHRSRGRRRR